MPPKSSGNDCLTFSQIPTRFAPPGLAPAIFSTKNRPRPIIPANLRRLFWTLSPDILPTPAIPQPRSPGKVDAFYGELRRRPQVDRHHWLWHGGLGIKINREAGLRGRCLSRGTGSPPGVLTGLGLGAIFLVRGLPRRSDKKPAPRGQVRGNCGPGGDCRRVLRHEGERHAIRTFAIANQKGGSGKTTTSVIGRGLR